MTPYKYILAIIFSMCIMTAHAASFEQWKLHMQQRMVSEGQDQNAMAQIFDQIQFEPRVIALDRKQPEGRMTLLEYVEKTVTPLRVSKGRARLQQHHALLRDVEKRYGVPAEMLVALWGKETDYGGYIGNVSTLNALATLAYEGRRRAYFEDELAAAVKLTRKYNWHVSDVRGSWAGAIGQCQFMPSHYLNDAVDADGDGRIDLWNSMPDIFSSMAQLLKLKGWQTGVPWGYRIDDPSRVRLRAGYRLYQPDGAQGPSYVITHNFDVLKRWNNSGYFATAVGRLADKISQP